MDRLADRLTNYIINKGVADKELYEVYRYGFISVMEITISIIISLIIAIWMNMIIECFLFFLVFIPLRSYAGGLHLEKYWSCLMLSCFTFLFILIIVKNVNLPNEYSLFGSAILLLIIRSLYPVEHINRPVDSEEIISFEKSLKKIIFMNLIIATMLFLLNWNTLAFLETTTLALVAITMAAGKIKFYIMIRKKTFN